ATLLIHGFNAWMVFRIARYIWDATGGAIALLSFVVFGMNMQVAGFALQSEHIVLAYALPGLLLTLKGMREQRTRDMFWGGLLLACCALVKQSGIFFCAAGVVAVVLHLLPAHRWRKAAFRHAILPFVTGAVAPIVLFLLILVFTGALDAFWYWIYQHPASYVAERAGTGIDQLIFFWQGISERHWFWIGLTASGLAALPFVRGIGWRLKVFLIMFFVLSMLTIAPGRRFYGHYWLMCFPAWSLLAPGLIRLIRDVLGARKGTRRLVWVPVLLLIGGGAWHFAGLGEYYFGSDLDMVMKQSYRDNYFPEHQVIGDFLNTQLQSGDQLIVMGSEPQIYLYTGRKSPTRHFYMTYTSKDLPEALRWEDEVIEAISTSKPKYIAFIYEPYSWMFKDNSRRKMYNWTHNLARARYETIAHMDLIKGMHVNRLITGSQAAAYAPASNHYITIYQRRPD
ncbi:MAG: hypothetical protein R3330_14310, partial [Saprospiraceae bacterium]|nr:hypothetical protein [Saprospiraceae bacterium]